MRRNCSFCFIFIILLSTINTAFAQVGNPGAPTVNPGGGITENSNNNGGGVSDPTCFVCTQNGSCLPCRHGGDPDVCRRQQCLCLWCKWEMCGIGAEPTCPKY